MNRTTDDVIRYFDERLDRYGATVRAVDWGSEASQSLRFRVLTEIGPLDGASLLDVGCGLGDLVPWLNRHHPRTRYEGCDLNPRMVAAARERFPDTRFFEADALRGLEGKWDWVLANGIFYLCDEAFLEMMTSRLFAACTRGVAFTTLSLWAPRPEPDEFHADPARVLAFCGMLTPRLTLRHDYLPHDFTMYLYRDA